MRLYGYPRSGNHFLMRSLWLSYFRDSMRDYRELYGRHFADAHGNPPELPDDAVVIRRRVEGMLDALWRVKDWFGLWARNKEEFRDKPYSELWWDGKPHKLPCNFGHGPVILKMRDNIFRMIEEKPIEHHARYYKNLPVTVEYEDLVAKPHETIAAVGKRFGLRGEPKIPEYPVGYGVRSMIPWDYGYATHLPLLLEYVLKTTGPVLELGAGHYSTPILHTLCAGKRLLVTVENDDTWRAKFDHLKSNMHVITDSLSPELETSEWDVVLVDSAPVESRVAYIDKLCYRSQYMILHDYGMEGHNYPVVYFKNKREWAWLQPKTMVVSHFNNVKSRQP